ncbi:unnamed protein product [Toxocara canis]|uniref:Regulating synaptic membrane exocytosis protein 2 n=1 Tax=Toxocara canis TaxID=6265 RepID=A0A183URP6_TOXCA|nr:unnamed protein product [Toxocara canis]
MYVDFYLQCLCICRKADQELEAIERQINERKETAQRLVGTQDDAICQICQKTKFADGIGHKCFYCQLRSCARCGGRTTSKNKPIWACSLCQKRQQILAKTGKWFQQGMATEEMKGTSSSADISLHIGVFSPTMSAPRTPQPPSQARSLASTSSQNISARPSVGGGAPAPAIAGPSTAQMPSTAVSMPSTTQPVLAKQHSQSHVQQMQRPPSHLEKRQNTFHRQPSLEIEVDVARILILISYPRCDWSITVVTRYLPHYDVQKFHLIKSPSTITLADFGRKNCLQNEGRRDSVVTVPVPQVNGGPSHRGPGPGPGPTLISESSRTSATPGVRRDASPARKNADYRAEPPRSFERSSRQPSVDRGRFDTERVRNEEERRRISSRNLDDRRLRGESSSFDDRERDTRRLSQSVYADEDRSDDRYRETSPRLSVGRRDDLDDRYSDRDYDERAERRRNTSMERGDRHERRYFRGAHSSTATRSSSRSGELRRSRSIRDNDQKRVEVWNVYMQKLHAIFGRNGALPLIIERVHAVPPASAVFPSAHTNRMKKSRLARQHRSMSSSEDEMPSTSDGHSGEELLPRADTEISSERGFFTENFCKCIRNDIESNIAGSNGTEPIRRFQRSTEVLNVPQQQSTVIPGDMLAAKIRTYLSHPVTWQPSADQRRLIGHMILHKTEGPHGGDLGLKSKYFEVVGGRRSDTGRLGAFITRVKSGSVADTVGRLRAGDEVLEWNGHQLQNATFDQVYEIISSSKNDNQVELIVSRSACVPGGDDFLNVQRVLPNACTFAQGADISDYLLSAPAEPMLSHSQSVTISPQMRQFFHTGPISSPVHKASVPFYATAKFLQISLYYSVPERQLVVTVHRAVDLPPRPDGMPRNPYVKLFLLPDRSEKSRRQSAVLAETCKPIWNEPFYYHGLTEPMLMERVLEVCCFVTVWDYDKFETNAFLGETLIDFSVAQLDDEPFFYTLVDMDEENPLRARLRHRRLSAYQQQSNRPRSEMSHYPSSYYQNALESEAPNSIDYGGYGSVVPGPRQQLMQSAAGMRRSRTYDRGGVRIEEDWTVNSPSGYLSDHGYNNPLPMRYHHRERRPKSATAMRPSNPFQLLDFTWSFLLSLLQNSFPHQLYTTLLSPMIYIPIKTAGCSLFSTSRDAKGVKTRCLHLGYIHVIFRQHLGYVVKKMSRVHRWLPHLKYLALNLPPQRYGNGARSPNGRGRLEAMHHEQQLQPGYGSDGSETLSIHSAHSASSSFRRAHSQRRMPNGDSEQRPLAQQLDNNEEEFAEEGAISDSVITKANMAAMKERKKSLMTRLIPGRNAPMGNTDFFVLLILVRT